MTWCVHYFNSDDFVLLLITNMNISSTKQSAVILTKTQPESTAVDSRTWLHVPSGILLSNSNDTHKVVGIPKETNTQMYTTFINIEIATEDNCTEDIPPVDQQQSVETSRCYKDVSSVSQ